jgi:hypothetical protein
MQALDAAAMAGCVETVSEGIVVVGGEREDAGLFRDPLDVDAWGTRGCGPGSVLREIC